MISWLQRRLNRPANIQRARDEFLAEMNDARRETIPKKKAAIQSLQTWGSVLQDGVIDYDQLNNAMFGREGWPREKEPRV